MHVPKRDEKVESKSEACNFMNVLEAQRLLRPLAVVMISMSPGVFLVSLSYILPLLGTGSQEGSIGMVAPHGNQLYTGSKAFISVLELSMVLIFHDELPQPNEKERDEGEQAKRESERLQEEFFALTPSGRSVCWWSTVRFSGKCISSLPPTQVSQTE